MSNPVGRPKIVKIPNITCTCGYSWTTLSERAFVCCPNCLRKCYNKVMVEKVKVEGEAVE